MATGANGGLDEWDARSCVGGGSGCLRGLPRAGRSSCALRGIMCKGVCCLMRSLTQVLNSPTDIPASTIPAFKVVDYMT